MPKIGRTLSYINTERKGKSTEQSSVSQSLGSSRPGGSISMPQGDYLLKSIWDKVFEIRTDSQGIEYIFGKLPMVTQYGITMYSGDGVDIPSLASGLPFDGRTIWYNPDTQQIEVIGGTGGGSGEGVSNFWDLSGIPSWITNSKPNYSYSEIEGTPDLTQYALVSQIPSLSGYATESWVLQKNYATKATTLSGYGITDAYTKTNVDDLLKSYVTLSGSQIITGEKNFTGGLKVNGSPIYYDTEKKYWKLEGDLLVTGGVTMYGNDSSFTPSTIMDAILYDSATLGINSNGQLYVKGGAGGGINTTDLQNYLTQNSYLNVTSGDNRYLKLSGGTVTGDLSLNQYLRINAWIGYGNGNANFWYDGTQGLVKIEAQGIEVNGYRMLNANNYSSYALPLSGGTLSFQSAPTALTIKRTESGGGAWIDFCNNDGKLGAIGIGGSQSPLPNCIYFHDPSINKDLKIWHEGNLNPSNYLPLSGGTLRGGASISWGNANNGLTDTSDWNIKTDGLRILSSTTSGSNAPSQYAAGLHVVGRYGFQIACEATSSNFYMRNIRDGINDWCKLWHEGNDGSGSGLDADLLDGKQPSELNVASAAKTTYLKTQYSNSTEWYDNYVLYAKWATDKADHLDIKTDGYYTRVDVAKKLNTARTIWGKSFDGTGNVDGNMLLKGQYVEITLQGTNSYNTGICFNDYEGNLRWYLSYRGLNAADKDFYIYRYTDDNSYHVAMSLIRSTGYVGIGTPTPARNLVVSNNGAEGLELSWDSTYGSILTYNRSTKQFLPFSISASVVNVGVTGVTCNLLVTGGITMYSDQRKKTILNHVELSLKQIAEAPLIEHYYNSDEKKTTHVGSIAQYWANMNDWFCKLDNEGYYTMEIQNAALASAISIARELDRYETKTDKAIKKLKKRICELEEEVERLKSA